MSPRELFHGGIGGKRKGDLLVASPPHVVCGCPICEARAAGRTCTVERSAPLCGGLVDEARVEGRVAHPRTHRRRWRSRRYLDASDRPDLVVVARSDGSNLTRGIVYDITAVMEQRDRETVPQMVLRLDELDRRKLEWIAGKREISLIEAARYCIRTAYVGMMEREPPPPIVRPTGTEA